MTKNKILVLNITSITELYLDTNYWTTIPSSTHSYLCLKESARKVGRNAQFVARNNLKTYMNFAALK